jgi:uncharacterized protein YegJ (DUF2314 family)
MIRPLLAVTFALLATTALAEDPVINFSKDDAEMNAAIAKARNSLPKFWQHVENPSANETDFAVKLGITDGSETEHFWCGDIVGDARHASCVIANEPAQVFTVKFGERVDIDPRIVSDWMYYRDGLIVGAETQRVMLSHMPADEAEWFRSMLAP